MSMRMQIGHYSLLCCLIYDQNGKEGNDKLKRYLEIRRVLFLKICAGVNGKSFCFDSHHHPFYSRKSKAVGHCRYIDFTHSDSSDSSNSKTNN